MSNIENILAEVAASHAASRKGGNDLDVILAFAEDIENDIISRIGLVEIAAHAIAELERIDAEAEDAEYLEQARALLVAAQLHTGFDAVWSCRNGAVTFYPAEARGSRRELQGEPDEATVESLARALRGRAG